ncbi:hypothetical protein BB561_002613 [Smittium simulii]|uniref:CDK5 regulatory subunit-associated protein 1 n=1 Tax=Smittium simulii TaxID=133385 RepID=A0A2T9YPS5_9FUNG|nr:hypothetical protein BB561_002613 [Smittium simulii]
MMYSIHTRLHNVVNANCLFRNCISKTITPFAHVLPKSYTTTSENKSLQTDNIIKTNSVKSDLSSNRKKLVFNNRTGPSLQHFLSQSLSINELHNDLKEKNYKIDAENIPYINEIQNNTQNSDIDWGQGRTFYVEVYGCQMNVNDTEILMAILEKAGYKRALSVDTANIVFLMTCSIREKAENKIWQRLKEIKAYNKKDKSRANQVIGVVGCMAERLKDVLLDQDKLVDVVCGPDAYRSLPRLLSIRNLTKQGVANVILSADETYADISPVRLDPGQINVHLSIMRGCNNMCSFCVVPFTRGVERSRPIESIINEVKHLSNQDVREITLLGQNVNSYRDTSYVEDSKAKGISEAPYELSRGFSTIYKKKEGGRRFSDLLELVSKVDPEMKIMFTSPHPKDFPDRLLHVIKENPNIARNIHLPAQSGSSTVLSRMRRGYTFESYIELVERIREIMPDITFSTDLIVGFCGETEEEFEQTLKLVRQVQFDTAFMFAYSLREKTHAHRAYKDDVPAPIKQKRLQTLIDLFHQIAKEKNKKYIGQEILVLVEKVSARSPKNFTSLEDVVENKDIAQDRAVRGLVSGHDEYNHKVFLVPSIETKDDPQNIYYTVDKGEYVSARVISTSSTSLTAEVLSKTSVNQYFKATQ